jgi:environmental stress-induced protein Ves
MAVIYHGTADYTAMPWRNGQGVTTELAREGLPDQDGFLWRLSRADVKASGPFSLFANIDRTLILLSGAGFTLDFGLQGQARLERRYQSASFSGDWPTRCTLHGGHCQDLNVMVDRRFAEASVTFHNEPEIQGIAADRTLLHVLEGGWRAAVDGGLVDLPADSLLVVSGRQGTLLDVSGSGLLLQIDIRLKDTAP